MKYKRKGTRSAPSAPIAEIIAHLFDGMLIKTPYFQGKAIIPLRFVESNILLRQKTHQSCHFASLSASAKQFP
jgi:hypothetical protein